MGPLSAMVCLCFLDLWILKIGPEKYPFYWRIPKILFPGKALFLEKKNNNNNKKIIFLLAFLKTLFV